MKNVHAGRPTLPDETKRSKKLAICVRKNEKEAWHQFAFDHQMSLSSMVRCTINEVISGRIDSDFIANLNDEETSAE